MDTLGCSTGTWGKNNFTFSPCIPSGFVTFDVISNSVKDYGSGIMLSDSSKLTKFSKSAIFSK